MRHFKCDNRACGHQSDQELQITLTGYRPAMTRDVKVPESHQRYDFCCHNCLVEWMKLALENEPSGGGRVLP